MCPNCYIFDFDGTIAYSDEAYREAFRHSIFIHTGIKICESSLRGCWNVTPEEILAPYGEELLERMMASFEEHYYANHHHLVPYEGIIEVLDSLKTMGMLVGIVSLKPSKAGELELDITGVREHIHYAVWGDDVARPKPDPDGVLRAVARLGSNVKRTMVIGDSPADIIMGRSAGAMTAAAMWGKPDRARMLAENPDISLEKPEDLLSYLNP